MVFSDRTILIFALSLACALGLIRVIHQRMRISNKLVFAAEFLQKLRAYVDSNGHDNESYGWLTHRSGKMQRQMGHHGIYASYRPPYANFQYSNYPIILNMLPELRKTFDDDVLNRGDLAHQYAIAIQEAIVRYVGNLDDIEQEYIKNLRNPFIWFREGVRAIVSFPVSILGWLGALSERTVSALISSKSFQFVSALVGIVGFISAVMGIALGWDQFKKMVLDWFNTF
jgi:hypothetical protein